MNNIKKCHETKGNVQKYNVKQEIIKINTKISFHMKIIILE